MGIGFVLLGIGLLLLLATGVVGSIVSVVAWLKFRRRGLREKLFKVGVAFAGPLIGIASMGSWWIAYAVHCEMVRGVDAGIGDNWYVPLNSAYQLGFIDTWEQAYVGRRDGPSSSASAMRVADLGRAQAVETDKGYAIFFEDGTDQWFETEGEFNAMATRAGFTSQVNWVSPADYFRVRRTNWMDWAWLGLLLAGLWTLVVVYLRFIFWEPPLYHRVLGAFVRGESMVKKLLQVRAER